MWLHYLPFRVHTSLCVRFYVHSYYSDKVSWCCRTSNQQIGLLLWLHFGRQSYAQLWHGKVSHHSFVPVTNPTGLVASLYPWELTVLFLNYRWYTCWPTHHTCIMPQHLSVIYTSLFIHRSHGRTYVIRWGFRLCMTSISSFDAKYLMISSSLPSLARV